MGSPETEKHGGERRRGRPIPLTPLAKTLLAGAGTAFDIMMEVGDVALFLGHLASPSLPADVRRAIAAVQAHESTPQTAPAGDWLTGVFNQPSSEVTTSGRFSDELQICQALSDGRGRETLQAMMRYLQEIDPDLERSRPRSRVEGIRRSVDGKAQKRLDALGVSEQGLAVLDTYEAFTGTPPDAPLRGLAETLRAVHLAMMLDPNMRMHDKTAQAFGPDL